MNTRVYFCSVKMSFVLLQKNGDVVTKKMKDMDTTTLYKKCGFRKDTDFERKHIWSLKTPALYLVAVYGKTKGRAGQENKSELPPPLDTTLFYGNIGIVRLDKDGQIEPFTKEEWKKVYEALYGGFEDLDNSSENTEEVASEDDEKNYDKTQLTKSGYLKDDFIVSDEEDDSKKKLDKDSDEEDIDDEDDENKDDDEEDEEDDNDDEEEDEEVVFEDEYTDSELSEDAFTDEEDT